MGGMFTWRVDKSLRIGAGLGLLLLLVAQEKVCPWLFTPLERGNPAQADAPDAPKPTQQSEQKEESKEQALPHVLPDAPAPRWPAAWSQLSLRETICTRDGVHACGGLRPAAVPAGDKEAHTVCNWRRLAVRPFEWVLPYTGVEVHFVDPAVETELCRHGPPCV